MLTSIVRIPEGTEPSLRALADRFLAENEKLNLSAMRTEQSCWIGNILDSLAALPTIERLHPTPGTLMDIGTGGGFPLLPLATLLPLWKCIGLDAVGKKIAAIKRIADDLKVRNVSFVTNRSEVTGRDPKFRERCDIVTARAVAPIRELLEYVIPFAAIGGHVLLWKSLHIADELEASKKAQELLACTLIDKHVYALPGDFGERQLLIFRKERTLATMYPRAVGMVKKEPL